MKKKASIGHLGFGFCLVVSGVVTVACSASDTVSVAPHATGGSGGASSGTAGAAADTGGGGSSATSAGGGMTTGTSGDVNPSTGGGAGVPIDTNPDASPDEGGADAATEVPPPISCPSATACLKMYLVHRYSFAGTGTVASDTVGTAHGTVMKTTLTGSGDVVLSAGSYVDLPNGIIKELTSATFETWVTWTLGDAGLTGWERLFDFGDSVGGEDMPDSAKTTLYLTPRAGGPTDMLAGFKRADQTFDMEARATSSQALTPGEKTHVAVVVDPAHGLMTLYRNGLPDGTVAVTTSLSMLNDVNNWLGRSQYGGDPPFNGTITEFRIYNAALPPDVVQASFTAGADATF